MWQGANFAGNIASATASTTVAVTGPIMLSIYNLVFNNLYTVLPYAIGLMAFFWAIGWIYRAARGSL